MIGRDLPGIGNTIDHRHSDICFEHVLMSVAARLDLRPLAEKSICIVWSHAAKATLRRSHMGGCARVFNFIDITY